MNELYEQYGILFIIQNIFTKKKKGENNYHYKTNMYYIMV